MPPMTPQKIVELQQNSDQIRNICILAHVDHGKTSLSDCLLASNGIISAKLAGRVRYLDSRPDEQLRGITMESSAISLLFRLHRRETPEADLSPKDYLINLIDSPGHIDFSSEVSTASRLCDGAIVLVDAVEGVCSQTVNVLRQSWIEHIRPILVINKIDRLVTELQLNAEEAFERMLKLVEQVNAVMGSFFAGERMEGNLKWRETAEAWEATNSDSIFGKEEEVYEERDDEDLYFAPEKHNVIFSSAIDGWAFTVRQFAAIYERKIGIKKSVLEKVLWGKYYLDPKTKRVLGEKHLKGRKLKPMFVQLVLESVWAVYQSTIIKRDQGKIEKIVSSLGLKLLPRDMRSKDTRSLLQTIFSQWLPLSTAVLVTVIEQLPSPPVAQKQRMPLILDLSPGPSGISPAVRHGIVEFDKREDAPVVAYVSKMIAVPQSELKKTRRPQFSAEEMREMGRQKRMEVLRMVNGGSTESGNSSTITVDDASDDVTLDTKIDTERLIGFARLYSGTVKLGQELYVLGPKYNPLDPDQHIAKVTVTDLYYIMGRDLEDLNEVPAGNVFGIGGLDGKILKNGTLVSVNQGGVNLAGVNLGATPIVRVALEPRNPSQLSRMVEGLKLLEQADPCAEYIAQDNGEHVLLTAGELHLERCLKDLRERFAKVDIQSSPPIVPFRETIVSTVDMQPPKEPRLPRGCAYAITSSKRVSLRLRVHPMPANVTKFLTQHSACIKAIYAPDRGNEDKYLSEEALHVESRLIPEKATLLSSDQFRATLRDLFNNIPTKERDIWAGVVDNIVSFGPRRSGPNLLIDVTGTGSFHRLLSERKLIVEETDHESASGRDIESKVMHAFQLFASSGPLCNEPISGVAAFIETIEINASDVAEACSKNFEVITAVLSTLRSAFLDWSPRLLLAMYTCDIQASTEVLGKVHDTVSSRRGRTIAEEQTEGNPFWIIKAMLPVVESFGFADEIRKRTSGAASPQLVFAGFEVLDEDPFWVPQTEEELEDLGETADRMNLAKHYMDGIRVRKGLYVQKKLVLGAEKQKTLKR